VGLPGEARGGILRKLLIFTSSVCKEIRVLRIYKVALFCEDFQAVPQRLAGLPPPILPLWE